MTHFIPIFPLKLVTYPNEKVSLHVFEDRYKELMNDCFEQGMTFGIPVHINGKIMKYGTELELESIQKTYEDGRMDVVCRGKRTFKIAEIFKNAPDKLYSGADVIFVKEDKRGDYMKALTILDKLEYMYKMLKSKRTVPSDPGQLYSFDIGHHVGFSVNQEYQLLSLETEGKRLHMILKHLEHLIPMVEETERLREKASLNGHFKNIIPPEV